MKEVELEVKPAQEFPFDVDSAVLCAGFAFEAYNEPDSADARWERGTDGCDVAFMSEEFAQEVYAGRLTVQLIEAEDLPTPSDRRSSGLVQTIVSGGEVDGYVIFALNEDEDPAKEGAIALKRAVDTARSSTMWSREVEKKDQKSGSVVWGDDEIFSLFVKDPKRAQLAMTVFDEEVLKADEPLGAATVNLTKFLQFDGGEEERTWEGWVPLTWRPQETRNWATLAGTVGGAVVGGPIGAAAGAFIGSKIRKPPRGKVKVKLSYFPFDKTKPNAFETFMFGSGGVPQTLDAAIQAKIAGKFEVENKTLEEMEKSEVKAFVLASKGGAKGASDGLDWSKLLQRVRKDKDDEEYELCCFLSHNASSTQVAMWRERNLRRVVLSFRGTSDILDVLTDVNLLQTPFEFREDGKKSDDPRMVHSGFFSSAKACNRRLKELLVAACAGTPGDWEVLITGHSLGGALATLMASEIAGGIDASRGFKNKKVDSWFTTLAKLAQIEKDDEETPPPTLGKVRMYTFGAPRVGNTAFAEYFDSFGMEAFRVVNGADIVPRMPRHSSSAGAVLDYEHVGNTVLIEEIPQKVQKGFWVEGESPTSVCPLRDVSPLTNPFSSRTVLGQVSLRALSAFETIQTEIGASTETKTGSQTLMRSFERASEEIQKASQDIQKRIQSAKALDALSLVGLNMDFVESEIRMIESIRTGQAIEHHLEPSYFAAMSVALDGWKAPKKEDQDLDEA
eukprot:CAMPEP_0177716546 /NCGR_PEP_ID=MMETSP0484_2-20121128/14565_1 /TAXON_ID=354590 /ORGANISM="Rhodomonas lens, Strain RHODO" /LENGTH=731 /DNA_ID=CAMNT_0019228579 /DNA_START=330 /DNA_END=2525 /DNA_ORIENTATION=+